MNFFTKVKTNWQTKKLTRPELAYLFTPQTDEQKNSEWVVIDCEMTGLNPKKNHILSVACIHVNQSTQGTNIDIGNGLNMVCQPPIMPTADSIVIHGLRPDDVQNGIGYDEMLANLLPFIGNRTIVGFCPQIDMAFLTPLVKAYIGVRLPNRVIDIRELYNRKTGNRTQGIAHQGQSLNSILNSYHVPMLDEHDAYNDAIMTAMAFVHFI